MSSAIIDVLAERKRQINGFKFCSDTPKGPYGCEYEREPQ